MKKGFTLIELLISLAIVGIIVTITTFGVQGARSAARDAKRKTDLQTVKAALELFYSDCGYYPVPVSNAVPNPIIGNGTPTSRCAPANTYLSGVPTDPQPTAKRYFYSRPTNTSYVLCASLEDIPSPVDNTGCLGANDCGTGQACNLRVSGP
jgi:general secretion pathway protein G